MNLFQVNITEQAQRALPWFRRGPRFLALIKVLVGPVELLRSTFEVIRAEIIDRNQYTAQRSHLERLLNLREDPLAMGIQVSDSTLASLVLKQITEPDPHVLLFEYTETTEDAVFVLVKGEEVSSYEVLVPAPIFALRSREIREIVEHFNPAAVTYRITDASFVFSGNGATGTGYNPAGPLYSGGFTQSAASLPPTPDLDT